MASPTTVDVIVPVHGGWAYVQECLTALGKQTAACRVIVVDDCSPDETPDRIATDFPSVELLRNPTNVGFAATCNRGIASGTGDIVLLVNSDVILDPHFVERLVHTMSQFHDAERVGSATALLLDNTGAVDSFGITADATAAGFVRFHGAPVASASAAEPPLLGPYGAVAAYRRVALAHVGTFDENIFMYGEELDLALRLRASGWNTSVVPGVAGRHIGGASTGVGSPRQRYLAGFGRGYLLRSWRVLRTRFAARAIAVEFGVCALRLVRHRDIASTRGRLDGWRAAKGATRPSIPLDAIDMTVTTRKSLRMRSKTYWTKL